MPVLKFRIRLHDVHRNSGLTVYRVAKSTGLNSNTLHRYVSNGDIITRRLESHVLELAKFYGVDWRDPAVVDVIEVDEEDES